MIEKLIQYFFVVCLLCSSCTNHDLYSLETINDTLHYIQIKTDSTINKWELPYPVYQYQIGDIDNNGVDDIMVGVIKTTRFDSNMSKRLFIFQNYDGLVRPLWLGSRLGQPLVDFQYVQENEGPRIRSVEKEKSGNYLVAEYRWRSFGLDFTNYLKREVDFEEAYKLLNSHKKLNE